MLINWLWLSFYRWDRFEPNPQGTWTLLTTDFVGPTVEGSLTPAEAEEMLRARYPDVKWPWPPKLKAIAWRQPVLDWSGFEMMPDAMAPAEAPSVLASVDNGWGIIQEEALPSPPAPMFEQPAALAALGALYELRDELPPDWTTRGLELAARLEQAAKFLDALELAFPNVRAPVESDVGSVMTTLGNVAKDAIEQITSGGTELTGRALAEPGARVLAGALAAFWQVAADGSSLYLGPEEQARELAGVAGADGAALLDGTDWRERMGMLQVVMDVAESGIFDKFRPPEATGGARFHGRRPAAWLIARRRRAGILPALLIGGGLISLAAAAIAIAFAWASIYFYKIWSRNKALRQFCFDENGKPLPMRNGVCRALIESAASDLGPDVAEASWWEKLQYLVAGAGALTLVLLLMRRVK